LIRSDGVSVDLGIDTLFQSYADAFARFDAAAVAAHWAFPAFFCARGKRAALDESQFRANVDAVIAFYRAQGAAQVDATVIRVEPMFAGLEMVAIHYCLADASGKRWRSGSISIWPAKPRRVAGSSPPLRTVNSTPGKSEGRRWAGGDEVDAGDNR
jgi:hypothetical protein